jgi:superfamily II DNA or RNA helicase
MLAPHQSDAVARILDRLERCGGVVLADDVGLGKSFVAAEVIRRFDGAAELIVPAALVGQWRGTLAAFATAAPILTHDALASDGFQPPAARRLVVVDEAHAFRNPATRRFAALARRTAGARVLLVTATPVCNSVRDLEALLQLIVRDDVLAERGVPSIDAAFLARDPRSLATIVAELVIRRGREVLPPSLQFGALERRVVFHDVPVIPELDELQFPLVGDYAILRKFLRRRLESSEAALVESVRRQLHFYGRALTAIAAGRTLPKRDYRRAFANEDAGEPFQEVLFWELFAPPGQTDPQQIRDEMARLEAIVAAATAQPSSKRMQLIALLRELAMPALVFTQSAATARDLQQALGCAIVTSRSRSRDAVLAAFCRGRVDVVVSTDMSAEGLNLQRAGVVVHYDLPWNPMKLDQRNGRAHRIGQTRETVRAVYFVPRSRETRIIETLARKNRMRRGILQQSSAEPVSSTPTLRPRLASGAAFVRLAERFALPEVLARRHKAGIELLMRELAEGEADQDRIENLITLVATEV